MFLVGCSVFNLFSSSEEELSPEEEYSEESSLEEEKAEETAERESLEEEDVEYIDEEDEDLLAMEEEGAEILEEEEESEEMEQASTEEDTPQPFPAASTDAGDLADTGGPAPAPESYETVDIDSNNTVPTSAAPAPVKTWVPLKKIISTPYQKAGFLVNAVYIAREGDSIRELSQNIFGSDQSQQLIAINPHIARRVSALKVGDKIYYESPQRPGDSSRLLFYFEDIGASPQVYSASAGENIRTIAYQLLGHKDSWKELWAVNPEVQSKGVLENPVQLKYWTRGDLESAPQPRMEEEPQPAMEENPTTATAEEPVAPPSPPPTSPPPEESQLMGDTREPAPKAFLDQKNMAAGGVLALVILILGFLILKKRKRKAFDYTAANFEIDSDK